jgi:6-phosphogluconolactonase
MPLRSTPEIVIVEDIRAIGREAARRVRRSATMALLTRGRWRIALAGGSTPRGLYQLLADEQQASGKIDWSKTEIFFGDERAVPPDHPDSNYRMVSETLLSRIVIPPGNVHRMEGEAADLDAAAVRYEAVLGDELPLDLAILGMGADGHTASLFPGTTALAERTRRCAAVRVPRLATNRITLTYPVFESAREVLFLIAGSDKAVTLREVVEGDDRPTELPSQPIVRRTGPVVILCDRDAAAELSTQVPP